MSKTPILDIIELPKLTLKELDISNNVESLVEIFNYNMNQLLDHHQNILNFSLEGVIFPTPTAGLSIQGDEGEKGNSVYPSPSIITNGSTAPISYRVDDTYLDPNGSLFVIGLAENGVDKVYVYSHTILTASTASYWNPQSSVVNSVQNNTFAMWNDAGNDAKGNIGAFLESNGNVGYYRLIIGDYKRNASISSSATFTNLIEAKTTNGLIPTDDASDRTISRDFSQIALKYRKANNLEPALETVYHKFYEPYSGRYEYNISNGASQISFHTISEFSRHAIQQPNSVGSGFNIKGDNFSLFDKDLRFYKSGDNFYMESSILNTTNTFVVWMNMNVKGALVATSISSNTFVNASTGVFSNSITSNSLFNITGSQLIANGNFNYPYMLSNGMRSYLINDGFVRDVFYVHTDNNLTNSMISRWDTKPDWLVSTNGNNGTFSNAGILNVPDLGSSIELDPNNDKIVYLKDYAGNIISTLILPADKTVPIGTVIWRLSQNTPSGFLPCKGASYNTTTYSDLFSEIGLANLPDLRGRFIRGWDDRSSGGNDNGRVFGSIQEDAMQRMQGHLGNSPNRAIGGSQTGVFNSVTTGNYDRLDKQTNNETYKDINFDNALVARTADENRPKNIAMNAYIKY